MIFKPKKELEKTKKRENMNEYDSLRNEIISIQEIQRNVWINMYILFCSLFVLGLEWSHYLFLVSYIIIIPFQCIINDYSWSISKNATYIRVFFEDEDDTLNWETFHVYKNYKEDYWKKRNSNLIGIIRMTGAIHLGILATGFFCAKTLMSLYCEGKFTFTWPETMLMLFSLILLGITFGINFYYTKNYNNELEEVMKEFKEKHCFKDNSKEN